MAVFWLEQRRARLTDPARQPYPIAHHPDDVDDYGEGGFAYVPGEFLVHPDDVVTLDLSDLGVYPMLLEQDAGWLAGTGLALRGYTGTELLPLHVVRLRAEARAGGVADPRVALHYVLTGEPKAGVPRGGSGDQPMPVTVGLDGASPEWAPILTPMIAVLDTGLAASSIGAQVPPGEAATRVQHDAVDDVDLLLQPGQAQLLDDGAGHGTFITALLNRMSGGVARIAAVRVLGPDGVGTEQSVIEGLNRIFDTVEPTVRVVNLSLGGFTDDGGWPAPPEATAEHVPTPYQREDKDQPPLALTAKLKDIVARHPGVVFVCCAGNDSQPQRPFWPAALAGRTWADLDDPQEPIVVAVGSLDAALAPSDFTNKGSWVTISTLGEDIVSEFPVGDLLVGPGQLRELRSGLACWSGTSFATPIVAAEIVRRTVVRRAAGSPSATAARDAAVDLIDPLPVGPPGLGRVYDPRTGASVPMDPMQP